jgi:hypothetical protein
VFRLKSNPKFYLLLLLFTSIIIYLFWGPLFPWNPIKPDYEKIASAKVTIYITERTENDSVVYKIGEILREAEQFHDLKYVDNIKIIIVDKESNMKRFLPWLGGSGYSVSLSFVDVIYIGPTARKSPKGIEPYLKHEMSHLLIGQNTTFKKGLKIHKQSWFSEGIAEYFSRRSFYSKNELANLIEGNYLELTNLREKSPQEMSIGELQLKYSYYGFFIEFLIDHYGLLKFQKFLKDYIREPGIYHRLFRRIYMIDPEEMLKKYHFSLTQGN